MILPPNVISPVQNTKVSEEANTCQVLLILVQDMRSAADFLQTR